MTRSNRLLAAAFALFALLPGLARPRVAAAEAQIFPDSTIFDGWQLPNGLRVVVRHLPMASHVAVTLAWPNGSDADPKDQTGRASLLTELLMTAAAGDTPERTRAELDLLRPAGWGSGVSPRVTQVTEIGTRAQFPGILRQMAQRVRGITVSDSAASRALATLDAALRDQRAPTSTTELYVASRALAEGGYDPDAAARGLKNLAKLKPAELQDLARRTFIPTGAVLSLAGNVGDMNLPALVDNEFGNIPKAAEPPQPPAKRLAPGHLDLKRKGLDAPAGVIGIFSPSLDDSLHPSFYLSVLFLGGYCQNQWRLATGPLTSRFQYSIFDDPELVRFYPPPGNGTAADSALTYPFGAVVSKLGSMMFPQESYDALLRGVSWLMGSPLPPETLARANRDPKLLATLSSNQAVRELWGGEPFWNEYRRRMFSGRIKDFQSWVGYLLDHENQSRIELHPSR